MGRGPELTRTPRGLRRVRTGYAYQPSTLGTYRRRRRLSPRAPRTVRTGYAYRLGRAARAAYRGTPGEVRLADAGAVPQEPGPTRGSSNGLSNTDVGRTSVSGDVADVSELAAEAAELAAEEQEVSRPMDRPVEQSVRARARARARVRICSRPRSRR